MTPRTPEGSAPRRIGIYQTWRDPSGGMEYEREMERALSSAFPTSVRNVHPVRLAGLPGKRIRQVLGALPDPRWDLSIRGFLPTVAIGALPRRPRGRQIVLIHHLDHAAVPRRATSRVLERIFRRGLRRADHLVVVAPYWERVLGALAPGLAVTVIHNGFAVDRYGAPPEEQAAFRRRYGFDDRPLVYLGNCQRAKGVEEAWRALRELPVAMVTSGRPDLELPVPNLDLDGAGYRLLLASCDVALAMSRFREGWNRTAHEALLSGTPVIGLDRGGLGDLLRESGQTLVRDAGDLPAAIEALLADPGERAARGREYARRFTLERFATAWRELVTGELDRAHG